MKAFRSIASFFAVLLGIESMHAKPAGVVTGRASWYGESYRGKKMANGQQFDPDALTCAAWDWPLGTALSVRYHHSRGHVRSVVVTVTDRGPDKRLGRAIDLSSGAFRYLVGDLAPGVVAVEIVVVGGVS